MLSPPQHTQGTVGNYSQSSLESCLLLHLWVLQGPAFPKRLSLDPQEQALKGPAGVSAALECCWGVRGLKGQLTGSFISALSFDTQDGVSWTRSGDLRPCVEHHMKPPLQLLFACVPISHPAVSPRTSRWFVFNLLSSSPLTPPSFHSPGKASLKTVMALFLLPPLSLPSGPQEGLRVQT